jgi:spermidine synthase
MPTVFRRDIGGTRYEVRSHGAVVRLYSDGVFHSAWNPRHGLTCRVWDMFLVAAFATSRRPGRVLLLGTGGGTSLLQLRRFLNPAELIGVELDPVHIHVARRYFGVGDSVARLVEADATQWVPDWRGEKFDLVIEDLFGHRQGEPARAVPVDDDWAGALGRLLAPGGVLAVNFIAPKDLRASALAAGAGAGYAGAFQLRTASDANAVGVWSREAATPRQWRARVRAAPGLDERVRGCPLDYEIRRLVTGRARTD